MIPVKVAAYLIRPGLLLPCIIFSDRNIQEGLALIFVLLKGICFNKSGYVCSAFYIVEQNFCTGKTVASCVVMCYLNTIVSTQHIEPVAHSGQNMSADLHRAKIWHLLFPRYAVGLQTALQNAHIKRRIVCNQNPAAHQGLYFLPYFWKHRLILHHFSAYSC